MLYLHIGTGKAGTTTIQNFLRDYEDELPYGQVEAFGLGNAWRLAAASGTELSHRYWVLDRKILSEDEFRNLSARFWQEVRDEVGDKGAETFVASSEYIHAHIGNNLDAIKGLGTELLDIFGRVKIIIYLREQVGFIKSVYSQDIKGPARRSISFDHFIGELDRISDMFHYAETIRLWSEIFGIENIEPVIFKRENFPNQNIIEDFCNRVDIEYKPSWYDGHTPAANVSPDFATLRVLRVFNAIPGNQNPILKLAYRAALKLVPNRGFPTKHDEDILRLVTPGNKWLNRTFFAETTEKLPELD